MDSMDIEKIEKRIQYLKNHAKELDTKIESNKNNIVLGLARKKTIEELQQLECKKNFRKFFR